VTQQSASARASSLVTAFRVCVAKIFYQNGAVIDSKSINKITFKSIYHAIMAQGVEHGKKAFFALRYRACCDDGDADSARWHNYFAIR
jgi:hypothetical protein